MDKRIEELILNNEPSKKEMKELEIVNNIKKRLDEFEGSYYETLVNAQMTIKGAVEWMFKNLPGDNDCKARNLASILVAYYMVATTGDKTLDLIKIMILKKREVSKLLEDGKAKEAKDMFLEYLKAQDDIQDDDNIQNYMRRVLVEEAANYENC